jgi:hypothetical protein
LQHELEHAFEYDRGIDLFTKEANIEDNDSREDQMRKYMNQSHEINARIVQYLYKINSKWSNDLKNKKWKEKHHNAKLDVENELSNVTAEFHGIRYLNEKNTKKFIKGVYTTLVYLWNHYNRQANKGS